MGQMGINYLKITKILRSFALDSLCINYDSQKFSSAHSMKMPHNFWRIFHRSNREPNQTESKLTVSSHDLDAGVSHPIYGKVAYR